MQATEYGSGAAGAIRSPDFQRAGVLARVHAPRLHWCYVAALAVGFSALPLGHANRSNEDVAQLERLTPRIERARTLSPEAKEAIDRVVARQSILIGSGDPSHDARRKLAIERIITAIKAKNDGVTVGNAKSPVDDAQ
jgi:hypothetical protein